MTPRSSNNLSQSATSCAPLLFPKNMPYVLQNRPILALLVYFVLKEIEMTIFGDVWGSRGGQGGKLLHGLKLQGAL